MTYDYNDRTLMGDKWEDKVCLTQSTRSCVTNFTYFASWNDTGLPDGIDGVLGLALNKQMMMYEGDVIVGPLFVDALFEQQ